MKGSEEQMKKLKELILGTSIIWMPFAACYLCGIIEKILGQEEEKMFNKKIKEQAKNAELRAVTHFRKLQKIEHIIKTEEANKTPAVFIVDKIKEVINPAKDK